jgi:predicted enzyme related to lactoylglutathione lyase
MNLRLNKLDLIVRDVPGATAFFHSVLGLTVKYAEERFAELNAGGGFVLMLSPDAMVPTQPAAGTILHFEVDNVTQALESARERGATVLLEPTRTDWGWESAMIAGPEGSVIDLYRPISNPA